MNRAELKQLILNKYHTKPDHPWLKFPNYEVFRRSDNQKWFALILNIPKNKLGLKEADAIDVANFKCSPSLIGSLRCEPGFFPAYHMNKEHWITAALDGSAANDKIEMLLDMSYGAAAPKARGKNKV